MTESEERWISNDTRKNFRSGLTRVIGTSIIFVILSIGTFGLLYLLVNSIF